MPGYPVTRLVREYKIMLAHLVVLFYKTTQLLW